MMISKLGESGSLNPLRTLNLLKLTPRVGLLFKETIGRNQGEGALQPMDFHIFVKRSRRGGTLVKLFNPLTFFIMKYRVGNFRLGGLRDPPS